MTPFSGAKFMCGGDSITYDTVTTTGAYRYYLAPILAAYIRTNPIWKGENPALGNDFTGKVMLGASGQRVDNLINDYDAANQFIRATPNYLLLHIGTNDVTQTISGFWVGGSNTLSVSNLSTLLDLYRAAVPSGIVFICKIIPNKDATNDAGVTDWNTKMATMVAARSDVAKIVIVDQNAAFKANPSWATDYMNDNTHPNSAGQLVMAQTFLTAIQNNIQIMARSTAQPHVSIRPHTASLFYNSSTATDLGSSVFLDSTQTWAVEWWCDFANAGKTNAALVGTVWELKTDQTNGFKVLYNGPLRGLDFGASSAFGRFFALTGNEWNKINSGFHHFVLVFDGVNRASINSYKLYTDGVNTPLTSGAGLGATGNVNNIGSSNGSNLGILYMSTLRVWNGGTALSAAQAASLYYDNIKPTGPTLTHEYLHTDGSGSILTDSVGSANGTIGTATWNLGRKPTITRTTIASNRTVATSRTVAT